MFVIVKVGCISTLDNNNVVRFCRDATETDEGPAGNLTEAES